MIAAALLLLPWSTGLHEVAMAMALVLSIWKLRKAETRAQWLTLPWTAPTLTLAGLWILAGVLPPDRNGPGHAWLLAPLLAVPVLEPDRKRTLRLGFLSFSLAALAALVLALTRGSEKGLTSHHLTLAYMLLPPLGAALECPDLSRRMRFFLVGSLTMGVLAARSEGAMVALAVTLLAGLFRRPWLSLMTGGVLTLFLLPWAAPEEQAQRGLLWTGGLAVQWPAGQAEWLPRAILEWDRLQPGFWFPYHAHDGAIQVWGLLGPAGLGALVWLLYTLLSGGRQAGLVGVLIGSLTQDVFGDLEVARSMWLWAMVMLLV